MQSGLSKEQRTAAHMQQPRLEERRPPTQRDRDMQRMHLFLVAAKCADVVREGNNLRAGERVFSVREAKKFMDWADSGDRTQSVKGLSRPELDTVLDRMSGAINGTRSVDDMIKAANASQSNAGQASPAPQS